MDGFYPGDFAAAYKALAPLWTGRNGVLRSHAAVLERLWTELSLRAERELPRIGFR